MAPRLLASSRLEADSGVLLGLKSFVLPVSMNQVGCYSNRALGVQYTPPNLGPWPSSAIVSFFRDVS